MNSSASLGDSAPATSGCSTTSLAPATPIVMNQTAMTGPKTRPTTCVPHRCTKNSAVRIAIEIGTTSEFSFGAAISSPSTADRTEIAGVMTLSP